jgi:hypothetical protein
MVKLREAYVGRRLAERISDGQILQACQVEPALQAFLMDLGFLR